MGVVDIVVICAVGAALAGAIAYLIYRKVKHKGGCCDCQSCSGCTHCKTNKK